MELKMYCITYDTKHGQEYIITWLHERLVLELDIKIYMYGHMTLTPRYRDKKKNMKLFTSDVHFNNEIAIDVAQTNHMTSLQVL